MKKEKKLWFKRSNDILILKEDLLVLELKTEIDEYYPEIKEKRGYLLAKFFSYFNYFNNIFSIF